jgi:hypothetical protein
MAGRGLRGPDKQQAGLRDAPKTVPDVDLPEGLKRQRQGPYDKDSGRAHEQAVEGKPQSPGQPAKGE